MSVLYPVTLRGCRTRFKSKGHTALKILLFLTIAILSFQGSFAQDEKEIQNRTEAELKKQEAARLIEKIRANPKLIERIEASPEMKQLMDQLSEEDQKKLVGIKADNEVAKYHAKMLEQQKEGP
jgi:beta-phosphoglucomutase-like phosphatase (HAD superfamily)